MVVYKLEAHELVWEVTIHGYGSKPSLCGMVVHACAYGMLSLLRFASILILESDSKHVCSKLLCDNHFPMYTSGVLLF